MESVESFLLSHAALVKSLPSEEQQKRAVHFMNLLGNPQEKMPVIHIAGTSGKGSTAYLTNLLLQSLGKKVGLYQSPHIWELNDMFQIQHLPLSKDKLESYFTQIKPLIQKAGQGRYGPPSSFEILTGLAYYIFWKEQVSYAVIETGLGGRYDATNVVTNPNKVAVITSIGFDHTDILGETLSSIASHKAGIIQKNNTVITIDQVQEGGDILKQEAKEKNAHLYVLHNEKEYQAEEDKHPRPSFRFNFLGKSFSHLVLGLLGNFQIQNASQALATLVFLSQRDHFALDDKAISHALLHASLPARMDIRYKKNQQYILDGAHNPQKMQALTTSLATLFPNKRFTFLLACKKGKEYDQMLSLLIPFAKHIILTSFTTHNMTLLQESEDPQMLANILNTLSYTDYEVIPSIPNALNKAIEKGEDVVITGSLYLMAIVYPLLASLQIKSIPSQREHAV